jgi:hypothetical protein
MGHGALSPFDENDLVFALGLEKRYDIRLMTNDTRTLAQATRATNRNVDHVIDELMKPWRGRTDAGPRRVLRAHTQRIFTQAHLDIHMLWHAQHVDLVAAEWTSVLGASPDQINSDVSTKHLTRLQAAHLHRDRCGRIERDLRALYEGIAEDANPVPVA